jgi:NEDD8-activating enzyme E1 regulatory subunit
LTFSAEREVAKDAEAQMMSEATDGQFNPPRSNFFIYLALSATSHQPEATSDEIMATIARSIPQAAGHDRVLQAAQEVARARGGELHNISALTGGMVAQETIKIITKQYIPVDDMCIFDGIASRCQVLRL